MQAVSEKSSSRTSLLHKSSVYSVATAEPVHLQQQRPLPQIFANVAVKWYNMARDVYADARASTSSILYVNFCWLQFELKLIVLSKFIVYCMCIFIYLWKTLNYFVYSKVLDIF